MASRLDLQAELETITGVQKVYYDPPASVQMLYPCIVYKLSNYDMEYADNKVYLHPTRYSLTVIDEDPESTIPGAVMDKFSAIRFDRPYEADYLHHWVFTMTY